MDKPIFYEGQAVGCLMFGEGTVLCIDTTVKYPIKISFENGNETYSLNGRFAQFSRQTLYPIEQYRAIIANLPDPQPEAWQPKPGEWCWFWDDIKAETVLRRFSMINGNRFECNLGLRWLNCAPFTGELPEHLKEVKP